MISVGVEAIYVLISVLWILTELDSRNLHCTDVSKEGREVLDSFIYLGLLGESYS